MTQLNLLLQPLYRCVSDAGTLDAHVLVRVQAPKRPAMAAEQKRAPLHLAVVLDRSGSMSGQPLREACRCASAIAERLSSGDQLAVVAYDNRVRLLHPCGPVTDLAALQAEIHSLDAGGSTNLHGGWSEGIEALRKANHPGVISRVLLLSDGIANIGITDPEQLGDLAQSAAAEGVSTSTYGLGSDFEEGLMTTLAQKGAGRSYYGELAEDLMDPFMEEFDLLSNLVARKLTVTFDKPDGFTVTQLNGYPVLASGGWLLPDLAYQAEAWALFRLQGSVPRKPGEVLHLGMATVSWQDSEGHLTKRLSTSLTLPVVSQADALALPKDPVVAGRLTELRIGRLQDLAHQAAAAEDWNLVGTYLDEMRGLTADNSWSRKMVDELSALMERKEHQSLSKELRYGFLTSANRLVDPDETADEGFNLRTSAYTRRKPRQGKGLPPRLEPPEDHP